MQLGVSQGTIKNHLHAIYERLGLDGRIPLLLYLRGKTLAKPDGSSAKPVGGG